jgi:glycosyltransferase involved in cell wall biosynthesis
MPAPFLLDLTHTSHTRARTGIQRVTRSLHTALGDRALAITHDPHRGGWRTLALWEKANLAASAPAKKRGAQWPLLARLRGRWQRLGQAAPPPLPANAGLIVPEVFSSEVAAALPVAFAATRGPRIALFHDAIALRLPELTPTRTVARFPAYLIELLQFDGIAAVSEDSRDALTDYWRWLGMHFHPPVRAIPLGIDAHWGCAVGEPSPAPNPPVVLCVGSIEGRKNHLTLLEACEELWASGARFELHLVGLAQPQTGGPALARIAALQASGRPLRYDGPVSDGAIEDAYARCSFTVYPSLMEGFGLPVIESFAHGKPCICASRGALGEAARGGGGLTLEPFDPASLAHAIRELITSPARLAELAASARNRRLKTWPDYANELIEWIYSLPPP